MVGVTKTNTITYTFEGDTLKLEQAILKVQSLLKEAQKNLVKYQEGGITELQQKRIEQLKRLEARLKRAAEKETLGPKTAQSVKAAGRKALSMAKQLDDQSIREKDKAIKRQREQERQQTEASIKAVTTEGQLKAHAQVISLQRMSKFLDQGDPTEKTLYDSIQTKIDAYKQAEASMDGSREKTNELAQATLQLNEAYKETASSLSKLESEQRKAQGKKDNGFLGYLFNKGKSLAIYRLLRALFVKITQEVTKSFGDIAQVSKPFNDSMSRLTSSFRYLVQSLSSVVAPIVQMITPIFETLTQVIGDLSAKLAELFSAMAGNDTFAKATYQVEDYANSLKKANQVGNIDELNKITTQKNNFQLVNIEDQENLEGFKSLLDSLRFSLKKLIDPLKNVLTPALQLIADVLSLIGGMFSPIIEFVSYIAGGVLNVVGTVLEWIANVIHTLITNLQWLIPLVVSLLTLWALFNWSSFIGSLQTVAYAFMSIGLKIWEAIKAAVVWVAQSIKTIAMNIKNAVAAWIAEKAYWKLALAVIAAAGVAAAIVAAIVISSTATAALATNKYQGSNPAVGAAMATGGVVTAPTLALVGEGNYPEAVVPLGQSPQFQSMKEGIASEVVNLLGGRSDRSRGSDRPIILQLNGRELARAILPDLHYALPQTGVKLR